MKTGIKKLVASLMLLSLAINGLGQESWSFGTYQKAFVTTASSPPLRIKMYSKTSLASGKFVARVGGVAFNAVARPNSSIKNLPIDYQYVKTNPDGQRLKVIIGNTVTYPYLPDWQLIPIVKYTNSKYNSCVSLFGPETDTLSFDIVYHSAFKNTLLGVRLLQADMALMDLPSHAQLPKFESEIIYGRGEGLNDTNWYAPASEIQNILDLDIYQSWVLTDDEQDVVFNIKDDKLTFSGYPYYHFWRMDYRETQLLQERYEKEVEKYNNEVSSLEQIIVKHDKLVELYNSGYHSYEGDIEELKRDYSSKEKYVLQLGSSIEKIENTLANYDYKANNVNLVTNGLKNKFYLYQKYNPDLYASVKNVAHYSAFFRFLKKENYSKWASFYKSCANRAVYPKVKTPTLLPK